MIDKALKRIAGISAVVAFFVAVILGVLLDHPLLVCSLRALGAGAVMYVVVLVAGRVIVRIVVEEMVTSQLRSERRTGGDD